MKLKMVASDLDGTLLSSSETLSERNERAMQKLSEKGVVIAVNTGRTLYEMPKQVLDCPFIDYFITSNGTAVYNKDKKIIFEKPLDDNVFAKAFETLNEYTVNMSIHDNGFSVLDADKATLEAWLDCNASEYASKAFLKVSEYRENFIEYYKSRKHIEMICCYFKSTKELAECKKRLMEIGGIQLAASSNYNLEIFNENASKGNALKLLSEKLAIDISDVVAAGDSINDISMFECGAYPVAVSNSMPAALEKAAETGPSNDGHIIEYILTRFVDN